MIFLPSFINNSLKIYKNALLLAIIFRLMGHYINRSCIFVTRTTGSRTYCIQRKNIESRGPAWPTGRQLHHLPPRRHDVHPSSPHPTASSSVAQAAAHTRTAKPQQCALARAQGVRPRLFRGQQARIQPLHGHQHAVARALHPQATVPLRQRPAAARHGAQRRPVGSEP